MMRNKSLSILPWGIYCELTVLLKADFPTAIGMVLERDDGSAPMEIEGDKGKPSGTTYFIDTNSLRVPRENMEVISPLKNGMSKSSI